MLIPLPEVPVSLLGSSHVLTRSAKTQYPHLSFYLFKDFTIYHQKMGYFRGSFYHLSFLKGIPSGKLTQLWKITIFNG